MKKLGLTIFTAFMFMAISISSGFADLFSDLNYQYTAFLQLDDHYNANYSGGFLFYYDDNNKTMALRICTVNNGTYIQYYLLENTNPKLFALLKEAIDKHVNLRASATTAGSNMYYTIRFWYKTIGTANIIKGFDTYGN